MFTNTCSKTISYLSLNLTYRNTKLKACTMVACEEYLAKIDVASSNLAWFSSWFFISKTREFKVYQGIKDSTKKRYVLENL